MKKTKTREGKTIEDFDCLQVTLPANVFSPPSPPICDDKVWSELEGILGEKPSESKKNSLEIKLQTNRALELSPFTTKMPNSKLKEKLISIANNNPTYVYRDVMWGDLAVRKATLSVIEEMGLDIGKALSQNRPIIVKAAALYAAHQLGKGKAGKRVPIKTERLVSYAIDLWAEWGKDVKAISKGYYKSHAGDLEAALPDASPLVRFAHLMLEIGSPDNGLTLPNIVEKLKDEISRREQLEID